MKYSDWVTERDYNSRDGLRETRITFTAHDPAKLDTTDRVAYYDGTAAQKIAELEELAEALREYRQALAARYGYLETAPYTRRIELKRQKRYDGKVYYYLDLIRTYEDGTETREFSKTYEGKERSNALNAFETLKRANPGAAAAKNIAKSKWEI